MLKKSEAKSQKTVSKKLSQEEFEEKIVEFAGKGLTSEKIGEELRKQGIHSEEYDKKISKILEEKNKYLNPDLKNIIEKLEKIKKHYEKHKQDRRAMREKDRIFARLRKMKKYHKII